MFTAHSGASGSTGSRSFWRRWNHESSCRESPDVGGREGVSALAGKAVARADREHAAGAMDDGERFRAGGGAEVPVPARARAAEVEWGCGLQGTDRRSVAA